MCNHKQQTVYVGCNEPLKVPGSESAEEEVEKKDPDRDGFSEKSNPVSGNGKGLVLLGP